MRNCAFCRLFGWFFAAKSLQCRAWTRSVSAERPLSSPLPVLPVTETRSWPARATQRPWQPGAKRQAGISRAEQEPNGFVDESHGQHVTEIHPWRDVQTHLSGREKFKVCSTWKSRALGEGERSRERKGHRGQSGPATQQDPERQVAPRPVPFCFI